MKRIIIQPTLKSFDEYERYANENKFYLEIVDFAFPDVINKNINKLVRDYQKKLKLNKKELSMHGAFIDIYIHSPDELIKNASRERIIQNLNVAKKLGVKSIISHTNSLPMMGREAYYDNWVKENILFWKEIIKKYKINILLENMWDKNPQLIRRVIDGVGSDKLRVCFDTGHCHIFSTVSMEEWFKELGKYITYIHLNDNHGDADLELPLGDGSIDWEKFNNYVKKYCNNPDVVFELKNIERIQKSINFLKKSRLYPFD